MSQWIYPKPVQPPDAFLRAARHPLIAKILLRRGLEAPARARAFLDPDAYQPSPPSALPGLPLAAARLREAIQQQDKIIVWGDFDVDGQTATALLLSALQSLGAQVTAYIPHRLREGHGIRLASLQQRIAGVDVLLTCDTGVSEHKALTYAQEQGVTVLVTDHHDLPAELPPADAIVNPKQLPADHPLSTLPGVAVAYKVIQELYRLTGQPFERAEQHLDLVALGIVADVATQTGETRYLLQRGMAQLRQPQRVGLQALMQSARINPVHLNTDHIGFGLGPRLNALGRLGDANLALELFTTQDLSHARMLAAQLEGLNGRRRLLTDQIYAAAQEQIATDPKLLETHVLVLSGPRWHPGVIGIVASRLVEAYDRPVILISEDEEGQGRGSARSVPGVDIRAALDAVQSLLTRYGGHPGAAGLSLPASRIPQFRVALSRAVEALWDHSFSPGLKIDAIVPWDTLSLELVDRLNLLAPFGEGNPPVVLVSRDLELVSERLVGRDQAHRQLRISDAAGNTYPVIWWRGAEHALPAGRFELAYVLKASDYRGQRTLQIEYVAARTVSEPATERPPIEILDYRQVADPVATLHELRQTGAVAIWAEGYTPDDSPGLRRDQLVPKETLAVWTPPPGPRELQIAVERTQPRQIILFGIQGPALEPSAFLPRLAGLAKYTLRHKQGLAELEVLAAASGQRAGTVRAGLHLLGARGDVRILEEGNTTIRLAAGDGQRDPELENIRAHLIALLQETAAYRIFFAKAEPQHLIETD